MMGKRAELLADLKVNRLKQHLEAGYSLSKAAKLMGVSYANAKAMQRRINGGK